ncbi:SIR2 family NAD-dependent protein deacylase [Vibrio sp. 10N.286.49.B1]|uniref:SIR2 family NAD-dependent protein deacylase n=1 Tax=unclassified Vibrio TaxID=2614977 RepID=UPI0018E4C074|nr:MULTISPECIES: Sir2 family NAD-dependent protein deacetylase [unclassified Vibrio]
MIETKKRIVVFTGAGISAESGLSTFRDSDGLWSQYPIEMLATKQALKQDPELVLSFYNDRINKANTARPNAAHLAIASLEQSFDVTVVTQNVDNLHERAGSSKIIHLHGQLSFAQSGVDASLIYNWHNEPIMMGQQCELGSQLRPNVVLFGEPVMHLNEARILIRNADKVLAVGSSLTVQPAANLLNKARFHSEKILISREVKKKPFGYRFLRGDASSLVPSICANWLRE